VTVPCASPESSQVPTSLSSFLRPRLGRRRAPAHVRGLYREKLDARLSPRTVQYVHVTLNKALKQAVADGLIPRNVCEAVKPPRPQKREISPLSPEQARCFLEACRGERLEALFVLAIHTGMRQGELLGLHWEDVDLETRTLRVPAVALPNKQGTYPNSPQEHQEPPAHQAYRDRRGGP